jgi:hypothetical protein
MCHKIVLVRKYVNGKPYQGCQKMARKGEEILTGGLVKVPK